MKKIYNISEKKNKYYGKVQWQSPANIALVKYWGKKGDQLPTNPSLSMTLSCSFSRITVHYSPRSEMESHLFFFFEGKEHPVFFSRIQLYIQRILPIFPVLQHLALRIEAENTFPHSAGIASSASSMSALALCLCSIVKNTSDHITEDAAFYQQASYIARLGSGSACRSIYGGFVTWGYTEDVVGSTDLYAAPLQEIVHPIFRHIHDTILLVDTKQKKISSSVGHQYMDKHPFKDQRFAVAQQYFYQLKQALYHGDMEQFMILIEQEALSLHAMMLCSQPYFILLKPNSLAIIDCIQHFRKTTRLPICFTIDAGPNIHLLYPADIKEIIVNFVEGQLLNFCENRQVIYDRIGQGPVQIYDN